MSDMDSKDERNNAIVCLRYFVIVLWDQSHVFAILWQADIERFKTTYKLHICER